jgi:hypothetical protein
MAIAHSDELLGQAPRSTATGIRTPVSAVRGRRPSPLDDGGRPVRKGSEFAALRREMSLPVIAAVALAFLLIASLSFTAKTDYSAEAQPAFDALRHGHFGRFLDLSPAYGGSLILRAPLALIPNLWGGGTIAVYRLVSAPSVLVLLLYGLGLAAAALHLVATRRAAWAALLLLLANPLAAYALLTGHSEEILVTGGCLAAAFATRTQRAGLAGLLFGLAVASKPWAVVAVGPLMLALERGRVKFLAVAAGSAAALFAPLALNGGGGLDTTAAVAHTTGTVANPWQIWWFLGAHSGPVVRGFGQVFHDYRIEPGWVTRVTHPLVVVVPAALCLARPRWLRARPWYDVFLLLAVVLFLRCLLDTWNHHYYALPAVLALGTWEVLGRRRAPAAAWTLTILTTLTIIAVPMFATADVQSLLYLAWALPFLAWLLRSALRPSPDVA